VVAWDVAEVELAEIAADLAQRVCLKERHHRPSCFGSRQCQPPPLVLHADNGNAMRGAMLESRLEEMGVLRSFSRPRVSNVNPYSESPFRTVKYRPDYPTRPCSSINEACEWVAVFVDWYNHRHRHSNLPEASPCLREGPPSPSKTLELIHSLLAPTQQTNGMPVPAAGLSCFRGLPQSARGGLCPTPHQSDPRRAPTTPQTGVSALHFNRPVSSCRFPHSSSSRTR